MKITGFKIGICDVKMVYNKFSELNKCFWFLKKIVNNDFEKKITFSGEGGQGQFGNFELLFGLSRK